MQFIGKNTKNPAKTVFAYHAEENISELLDSINKAGNIAVTKLSFQYKSKSTGKTAQHDIPLEKVPELISKHKIDIWLFRLSFSGTSIAMRFSQSRERADFMAKGNDAGIIKLLVETIDGKEDIKEKIEDREFVNAFSDNDFTPEQTDTALEDPTAAALIPSHGKKDKKEIATKKKNVRKAKRKSESDTEPRTDGRVVPYIILSIIEFISFGGIVFGGVSLFHVIQAKKNLGFDDKASEYHLITAKTMLIFGAMAAIIVDTVLAFIFFRFFQG